jgi:hypothetical protein
MERGEDFEDERSNGKGRVSSPFILLFTGLKPSNTEELKKRIGRN